MFAVIALKTAIEAAAGEAYGSAVSLPREEVGREAPHGWVGFRAPVQPDGSSPTATASEAAFDLPTFPRLRGRFPLPEDLLIGTDGHPLTAGRHTLLLEAIDALGLAALQRFALWLPDDSPAQRCGIHSITA